MVGARVLSKMQRVHCRGSPFALFLGKKLYESQSLNYEFSALKLNLDRR